MLSKSIWNSFPRTIRNEKIWITNTQEGRGGGGGNFEIYRVNATLPHNVHKEGGSFRSRLYTAVARPNGPFYDSPRQEEAHQHTAPTPRKSIPRDPLTKRYLVGSVSRWFPLSWGGIGPISVSLNRKWSRPGQEFHLSSIPSSSPHRRTHGRRRYTIYPHLVIFVISLFTLAIYFFVL